MVYAVAHKKIILMDVDGVLRDVVAKCCQIYKRDFDPKSTVTPEDITDWGIDQFFPKLPEARMIFFREYADEVFTDSDPYEPEVAEYMAMIKEGNELIIATDQWNGNGKYTLQWLENQRIPYDGIFISPNKALLNGDIALDDRLKNLVSYRDSGITAVCMERPWNKARWDRENGKSVHNLYEFNLLIHKLKNRDHELADYGW